MAQNAPRAVNPMQNCWLRSPIEAPKWLKGMRHGLFLRRITYSPASVQRCRCKMLFFLKMIFKFVLTLAPNNIFTVRPLRSSLIVIFTFPEKVLRSADNQKPESNQKIISSWTAGSKCDIQHRFVDLFKVIYFSYFFLNKLDI